MRMSAMLMPMRMIGVAVRLPSAQRRPIFLTRQVFLSVHPNIYLCRRDPTAHHPRYFQPRPHVQSRNSLLQQRRRDPGIHQRSQKHVAADSRKTLKVGNAHWKLTHHRGTETQRKAKTQFYKGVLLCDSVSLWWIRFLLSFHHREACILRQTCHHRSLC